MARILVTGANGFVGRELVARLRRDGHDVVPAVRRPSDMPCEVLVGEIDGQTDWSRALAGVEKIVHLAARTHVMRETAADPLALFRAVNRDGTAALLQQAKAAGVSRFVFVSSIKVNGEATAAGRPFRASDPPRPEDAYGQSKLEAEQAIATQGGGIEICIVRPPLVYGPAAKGNLAALAAAIERGLPLPMGRATGNLRSLIGVENLADLLACCVSSPAAANRLFLASDGEDLSTRALVERIGAAIGRKPRLLPVPVSTLRLALAALGRGSVAERLLGNLQVDAAETRAALGWRPPLSLAEGFQRAFASIGQPGSIR